MTPLAVLHFVEAFLWCAVLFTSITGWGALLFRLFGLHRPLIASAATTGFGVVLLFGGLLNLAHGFTVPILLTLIVAGVLAALALRPRLNDAAANAPFAADFRQPTASPVWARLLLILFFSILALRLIAVVHVAGYQDSDDFNFYLGEPLKTLQLHSYVADPFSERRIMASLGGSYFLQDLILVALPLENVQMADRALGLVLLALAGWAIATRFKLTPTQRAGFCVLLMIVPQLSFNLTFTILPSALLVGLVLLAANHELLEANPLLLGVIFGLVAAASGGLKNTYLPHPVFFVFAVSALQARRKGLAAGGKLLLTAAACCAVAILPWMYADHITSGTWFYPSLGPGFHYTAYGIFLKPSSAGINAVTHKVIPFCLPIVCVLLATLLRGLDDEENDAMLSLMGATTLAAFLIGLATGGESIRRYCYPSVVPCVVLLYVVASRRINRQPALSNQIFQWTAIIAAIAASLTIGLNKFTNEFAQIPMVLRGSFKPFAIVPAADVQEYAALQAALPHDAPALASVQNSFLLDFRAHTINIADIPGAAGLPPGWPNRKGPEALAAYLQANGIRYLIYDYAAWSVSDLKIPAILHDPVHHTQWIRDEHEITGLAHQQYLGLAKTRKQLYNDGKIFVLDLATPAR